MLVVEQTGIRFEGIYIVSTDVGAIGLVTILLSELLEKYKCATWSATNWTLMQPSETIKFVTELEIVSTEGVVLASDWFFNSCTTSTHMWYSCRQLSIIQDASSETAAMSKTCIEGAFR